MDKLRSDSNEVKFMSLKVFTDIVMQFLYDESVFDAQKLEIDSQHFIKETDRMSKYTTDMINDIIINSFIPNFKYLLNEEDPIPLFAIKLMTALADRSEHFVAIINKMDILPIITEYCSGGHKRLNQHTITLIKKITNSPDAAIESYFSEMYKT
mmetsp:Transcript_4859/g.4099  ORF Transcript_4859/g.4099 Transcript_4859/m.4099 type:complete len:154 (-) Transcript_4859:33-494(-)